MGGSIAVAIRRSDGREWFESRGWKTPVLDLPDEFLDDDEWDEDEEE